jgi:acetyl-CoA C-acetyltransferase
MRRVAVIGAAYTKFDEHWEKGFRELAVEAGLKAIQDAKIDGAKIQAIYGGNMSAGRFVGQEHIGALLADQSGLNPVPATRVEAACASGGLALREGYISVASGLYDCVIVGGVEKMTDIYAEQAATTLGGAGDQEWEVFFGATFPALYAIMARRHMHDYGTKEEQMAAYAVKNHFNASMNPNAQYPYEITVEDVMKSSKVADPLKLLDCSPLTDGAAAVILASEDFVKNHPDDPIWIAASGQASDTLALHDRACITALNATKIAVQSAYKQAGVKPQDIDVAELHDCFTIAELMAVEDLGFVKKGEGGNAIEEGIFDLNSKISTNTSGGLKACGHPVGATGVKQAAEIVFQLRGQAGKRQVDGAEIGLTHNVGGTGATCVVHIFKR